MGNIYVTCARCNKEMTIAEYNCVFCSDIDNQIVCVDCYKKEQPKELMKQIADLEAKLAESEKKARTYAKEIVFLDKKLEDLNKEFELAQEHNEKTVEYWQNECSQLNQQLAEKEKEIERLKQDKEHLNYHLIDKNCECELFKLDQNQTAIAELEEVKQLCDGIMLSEKYISNCDTKPFQSIIDYINQQIKSLKGEN